ncbi:MAG: hypothetical protein QM722_19905 [Piscinibacter sp.]
MPARQHNAAARREAVGRKERGDELFAVEHGAQVCADLALAAHQLGILQHLLGLDQRMAVVLQQPLDHVARMQIAPPPRDAAAAVLHQRLAQRDRAAAADGPEHHHQVFGDGARRQRAETLEHARGPGLRGANDEGRLRGPLGRASDRRPGRWARSRRACGRRRR